MPLVRVFHHVSHYSWPSQKRSISSAIYDAMRETINIPEGDNFIVFSALGKSDLQIDPNFQGMNRTRKFLLVQITLSKGRTVEQKQALYARIAERLHETAKIQPDDVMIVLTENNFEDWSFGKGQAQYVLNPPAWARKTEEGN